MKIAKIFYINEDILRIFRAVPHKGPMLYAGMTEVKDRPQQHEKKISVSLEIRDVSKNVCKFEP